MWLLHYIFLGCFAWTRAQNLGTNFIDMVRNDVRALDIDIVNLFQTRVATTQRATLFNPCRPSAYPTLSIPGFCCSLFELNALCSDLEISASDLCINFEGNFCCYLSVSQGNTIQVSDNVTSATVTVQSTSPTTPTSAVTSPASTSVSVSISTSTSNVATLPLVTAAQTAAVPSSVSTAATTTTTTTTITTPSTATTTTPTTTTTTTPITTTSTTTITRTTATSPSTTTTTTMGTLAPAGPPQFDTSSQQIQQLIVDLHNDVRRAASASNMLKIQWNAGAAVQAQSWANACVAQHGPDVRNSSTFSGCGQNIANGNGITSWNQTVKMWADEISLFKFGQNPCPDDIFHAIGHYTQIVWYRSFQIGCGFAACPNPVGNFFVCNYCPAGNSGNVCLPYLPGTSSNGGVCGKCGGPNSTQCDQGLCTTPCLFTNVFSNCDIPDPNNPTKFPALFPDTSACSDTNNPFVSNKQCQATCNCRNQGLIY